MNLERGGQADPQTYLNAQPYFYPQNDLLSVLDRIRWPAEPTAGDLDPRSNNVGPIKGSTRNPFYVLRRNGG